MLVNWRWNTFFVNNLEIIDKIEENKGLCAKIDEKRTAYSTNGAIY